MSIRNCPECSQPVSTAARTCPHCGCPLRNGRKPRSVLGPILLGLLVTMGLASLLNGPLNSSPKSNLQNAQHGPRCNAAQADQIVKKAIEAHLIYRIQPGSVAKIYIMPAWRALPLDDKQVFDNAIQCYLTRGEADPVIASYLDYQSGHEVADTSQYGLITK